MIILKSLDLILQSCPTFFSHPDIGEKAEKRVYEGRILSCLHTYSGFDRFNHPH